MSKPINVTEADFEQLVENSDIPVMVDFWADWCGPCKMIAPTLDQLADEYDGKVLFGKEDGPRFGTFVAIYGVDKTIDLIKERIGNNS